MDTRLFAVTRRDNPLRSAAPKRRPPIWLLLAAAALLLSSCASTRIPKTTLTASDPDAVSLLTASQRAHGAPAFASIRDLNIRSVRKWSGLGAAFQAGLSDRHYRRQSEEALDLTTGTIVQLHQNRGARKFVLRAPGRVTVWYNGQPDARESVIRAAALAADTDRMLLLGPLYFQRPGVILEKLGTAKVAGAECDEVLATLRPGFGFAEEDRVVLAIDQKTQRLRRARLTLNGLREGGGGEAEVIFRNWGERSGVWWATERDERQPGWVPLPLCRWVMPDLKANHGFAPRQPELVGEAISEASRLSQ
jgi:hypothetical protein